jgi:hypothetical protein
MGFFGWMRATALWNGLRIALGDLEYFISALASPSTHPDAFRQFILQRNLRVQQSIEVFVGWG